MTSVSCIIFSLFSIAFKAFLEKKVKTSFFSDFGFLEIFSVCFNFSFSSDKKKF